MARVRLNTDAITGRESFHAEFQRALGFPDFYGANMDAWIDCMSYLRDGAGMTALALQADEVLVLEIPNAEAFRRRFPKIAADLWDCTAIVNSRYMDRGEKPAILLLPVCHERPRSAS